MTLTDATRKVVVIGGGLAGISAAVQLAEAGLPVTLIEARPWLGGATCSFVRRGLAIDNGQHMFLRSYTAYRELLGKLGSLDGTVIQDRLDITVLTADAQARLRRSDWPSPLHLASSVARYRLLSVAERAKVALGAVSLLLSWRSACRSDDVSFGDWLGRAGQDWPSRRLLWDLIGVAALNVAGDEASLALATAVVRKSILGGHDRADIGLPSVPLGQLHGGPAAGLLTRLGAEIRVGAKAVAIDALPAGGYRVQLTDRDSDPHSLPGLELPEAITAGSVVLAVPAWAAGGLVPAPMSAVASTWSAFKPSPAISLHVLYATRVTSLPFAAAVQPSPPGAKLCWIVDKTSAAGLRSGQYLAISLPAADRYVDMPPSQLGAEFLPWLAQLFPAAAAADVEDFFVTRERRATILQVPGSQRPRPGQPADLPGFALAGAWIDTGWPDTMEGAVRSGLAAARKVLLDLKAGTGMAAVDAEAESQVSALRR